MDRRLAQNLGNLLLVSLLGLTGCSLSSQVSITPLNLLPTQIERGSDVHAMVLKADYLRAIELASTIEGRQKRSAVDLAGLGHAELISGRYDAARQHLRAAFDLDPKREILSDIAWDLSQVEYLCNNYESSLDWANVASRYGLRILDWHLAYMQSLANVDVYRFSGYPGDQMTMKFGNPDVPRVDVRVNKKKTVQGVIDSGAVLSILSERFASSLPVKRLGDFQGTFYGLLGEPIPVHFGLLETLEIGGIVIENVPVAIMPDESMKFLISDKREFRMDFLLGANLLKEFRTDLNFADSYVSFTHLTQRDRRPDPDQNLFITGFRPLIRGTVQRHGWFLFVLDTGSEVTFLNEGQMARLPISMLAPHMHDATLQGLGGSQKHGAKIEDIEIGFDKWAGMFKNLPMYGSSAQDQSAGIVGENFLKNFRVIIDFGRMRVDLIRSGAAVIPVSDPPDSSSTLRASGLPTSR